MAFLPIFYGFRVNSPDAIDSRFTVANEAARLTIPSGAAYEGLITYAISEESLWVLTGSDPSVAANWTRIDDSGLVFGTTDGDIVEWGEVGNTDTIPTAKIPNLDLGHLLQSGAVDGNPVRYNSTTSQWEPAGEVVIDTNGNYTITNTEPEIVLSSSGTGDNAAIAKIEFEANNDSDVDTTFSRISSSVVDRTNRTSEIKIETRQGDTIDDALVIDSSKTTDYISLEQNTTAKANLRADEGMYIGTTTEVGRYKIDTTTTAVASGNVLEYDTAAEAFVPKAGTGNVVANPGVVDGVEDADLTRVSISGVNFNVAGGAGGVNIITRPASGAADREVEVDEIFYVSPTELYQNISSDAIDVSPADATGADFSPTAAQLANAAIFRRIGADVAGLDVVELDGVGQTVDQHQIAYFDTGIWYQRITAYGATDTNSWTNNATDLATIEGDPDNWRRMTAGIRVDGGTGTILGDVNFMDTTGTGGILVTVDSDDPNDITFQTAASSIDLTRISATGRAGNRILGVNSSNTRLEFLEDERFYSNRTYADGNDATPNAAGEIFLSTSRTGTLTRLVTDARFNTVNRIVVNEAGSDGTASSTFARLEVGSLIRLTSDPGGTREETAVWRLDAVPTRTEVGSGASISAYYTIILPAGLSGSSDPIEEGFISNGFNQGDTIHLELRPEPATMVATEDIVNGAVRTDSIHDLQVTGAKIANDTIDGTKFLTNSITTAKIADDAITGFKLNSNSAFPNAGLAVHTVTDDDGNVTQQGLGFSDAFVDSAKSLALNLNYTLEQTALTTTTASDAKGFITFLNSATDNTDLTTGGDGWDDIRRIVLNKFDNRDDNPDSEGPERSAVVAANLAGEGAIVRINQYQNTTGPTRTAEQNRVANNPQSWAIWKIDSQTIDSGSYITLLVDNQLNGSGNGLFERSTTDFVNTSDTITEVVYHGRDINRDGGLILDSTITESKLAFDATSLTFQDDWTEQSSTNVGSGEIFLSPTAWAADATLVRLGASEKIEDVQTIIIAVRGNSQLHEDALNQIGRNSLIRITGASGNRSEAAWSVASAFSHPTIENAHVIRVASSGRFQSNEQTWNQGTNVTVRIRPAERVLVGPGDILYTAVSAETLDTPTAGTSGQFLQRTSGGFTWTDGSSDFVGSVRVLPSTGTGVTVAPNQIAYASSTNWYIWEGTGNSPLVTTGSDFSRTLANPWRRMGEGGSGAGSGFSVDDLNTGTFSVDAGEIVWISANEWYQNVSSSTQTDVTVDGPFTNTDVWRRYSDAAGTVQLQQEGSDVGDGAATVNFVGGDAVTVDVDAADTSIRIVNLNAIPTTQKERWVFDWTGTRTNIVPLSGQTFIRMFIPGQSGVGVNRRNGFETAGATGDNYEVDFRRRGPLNSGTGRTNPLSGSNANASGTIYIDNAPDAPLRGSFFLHDAEYHYVFRSDGPSSPNRRNSYSVITAVGGSGQPILGFIPAGEQVEFYWDTLTTGTGTRGLTESEEDGFIFNPGDDRLYVESVDGFPDSGTLLFDKRFKVTYTGRDTTDNYFSGIPTSGDGSLPTITPVYADTTIFTVDLAPETFSLTSGVTNLTTFQTDLVDEINDLTGLSAFNAPQAPETTVASQITVSTTATSSSGSTLTVASTDGFIPRYGYINIGGSEYHYNEVGSSTTLTGINGLPAIHGGEAVTQVRDDEVWLIFKNGISSGSSTATYDVLGGDHTDATNFTIDLLSEPNIVISTAVPNGNQDDGSYRITGGPSGFASFVKDRIDDWIYNNPGDKDTPVANANNGVITSVEKVNPGSDYRFPGNPWLSNQQGQNIAMLRIKFASDVGALIGAEQFKIGGIRTLQSKTVVIPQLHVSSKFRPDKIIQGGGGADPSSGEFASGPLTRTATDGGTTYYDYEWDFSEFSNYSNKYWWSGLRHTNNIALAYGSELSGTLPTPSIVLHDGDYESSGSIVNGGIGVGFDYSYLDMQDAITTRNSQITLEYNGTTIYDSGEIVPTTNDPNNKNTLFDAAVAAINSANRTNPTTQPYRATGNDTKDILTLVADEEGFLESSWVWDIDYDNADGALGGAVGNIAITNSLHLDGYDNYVYANPLDDYTPTEQANLTITDLSDIQIFGDIYRISSVPSRASIQSQIGGVDTLVTTMVYDTPVTGVPANAGEYRFRTSSVNNLASGGSMADVRRIQVYSTDANDIDWSTVLGAGVEANSVVDALNGSNHLQAVVDSGTWQDSTSTFEWVWDAAGDIASSNGTNSTGNWTIKFKPAARDLIAGNSIVNGTIANSHLADNTIEAGKINTGGNAPSAGEMLVYDGTNLTWSDSIKDLYVHDDTFLGADRTDTIYVHGDFSPDSEYSAYKRGVVPTPPTTVGTGIEPAPHFQTISGFRFSVNDYNDSQGSGHWSVSDGVTPGSKLTLTQLLALSNEWDFIEGGNPNLFIRETGFSDYGREVVNTWADDTTHDSTRVVIGYINETNWAIYRVVDAENLSSGPSAMAFVLTLEESTGGITSGTETITWYLSIGGFENTQIGLTVAAKSVNTDNVLKSQGWGKLGTDTLDNDAVDTDKISINDTRGENKLIAVDTGTDLKYIGNPISETRFVYARTTAGAYTVSLSNAANDTFYRGCVKTSPSDSLQYTMRKTVLDAEGNPTVTWDDAWDGVAVYSDTTALEAALTSFGAFTP